MATQEGTCYLVSMRAAPSIIKVGRTRHSLRQRLCGYTGLNRVDKVIWAKRVCAASEAEANMKDLLKMSRIVRKRADLGEEWFEMLPGVSELEVMRGLRLFASLAERANGARDDNAELVALRAPAEPPPAAPGDHDDQTPSAPEADTADLLPLLAQFVKDHYQCTSAEVPVKHFVSIKDLYERYVRSAEFGAMTKAEQRRVTQSSFSAAVQADAVLRARYVGARAKRLELAGGAAYNTKQGIANCRLRTLRVQLRPRGGDTETGAH